MTNIDTKPMVYPILIASLGLSPSDINDDVLTAAIALIRKHGRELTINQLQDIDDAASHLDPQAQAMIYDALLSQGIND